MNKSVFLAGLLLVPLQIFANSTKNVPAHPMKLVGFVKRQSAQIITLDTGSVIYKLKFQAVLINNPQISKLPENRQTTIVVEPIDILSAQPLPKRTER